MNVVLCSVLSMYALWNARTRRLIVIESMFSNERSGNVITYKTVYVFSGIPRLFTLSSMHNIMDSRIALPEKTCCYAMHYMQFTQYLLSYF